jgi:hypothetical protein
MSVINPFANHAVSSAPIAITDIRKMRELVDDIVKQIDAEAREASRRTGIPWQACRLILAGQRVPVLEEKFLDDGAHCYWVDTTTLVNDGITRGVLAVTPLWLTRFRFDMWMTRLERALDP